MSEETALNTDKAYYVLFRQVNKAIDELDKMNFGAAREILINAQKVAEDLVISGQ